MVGRVKSNSTGEIPLGPFVPRNGVKVTAGTITLIEGVDYEIDIPWVNCVSSILLTWHRELPST